MVRVITVGTSTFIFLVQSYLQFQLLTMSRLSPYRKQPNPKKQHSPHTTHFQYSNPYIPNDRLQSILETPVDENKYRYYNQDPNIGYKLTEKKKNDNISNFEFQTLLQKNRSLAQQNAEIYELLEERGKIVTALEKKLEEQIYREVNTLQMIEKEKNKFIVETQRKFAQYENKIEQLKRQIHNLKQQKYCFEMTKVQEIEAIKDQFTKEQLMQMQTFANDQMTAREVTQQENNKIRQILSLKDNELDELTYQYKSSIDKLKNEIITLNNEILHINHLRKIELSEQKIMYENMISNITKENAKEKELMQVEHDIVIKKLQQQITSKVIENSKISQLKKINEIQQNIRENQLLQKKGKLEEEIKEIEHFYRQKSKQEAHNRKEINKTEVEALSHGNQALVKNLRSEIEKLVKVNEAKTEEINSLYAQIQNQRQNNNQQIKNLQQFIEELKNRMQQMERDHLLQDEQLKIRWAQLSQTNMITLKQFYEHELAIVNQQLLQKTALADSNRQKLHFELQDKNQLKKRYDLQMMKSSKRVNELQLQLSQMILAKREETSSMSANVQLTSQKLLQQSKDRQKLSQNNEQEKRRLQELILAKDYQIQQLNRKIQLLRENLSNQIAQKIAQLEIVKKQKEDVQNELKKQKLFYENELKKKDAILKENKEHFEEEYNRFKQHHRTQYDQMLNQYQSKIKELLLELNHMRSVQKNLNNMIDSLKEEQGTEIHQKQNELANQKQRMSRQKKQTQERLHRTYQQEIARLKTQIEDLRKRLDYKHQDLNRQLQKYHNLQLKMQAVMESQERLRNLEEKILHLGQQNNLVKNITEAVKIQISQ